MRDLPALGCRCPHLLVIAIPSYRFFEAPIRSKGLPVRFPIVVALATVVIGAIFLRNRTDIDIATHEH